MPGREKENEEESGAIMRSVDIPSSLRHPFFFEEKAVDWPEQPQLGHPPFFIYEIMDGEQPWLKEDKGQAYIKQEWAKVQTVLEGKFRERNGDIKNEMRAAIALFFMKLFWSNGSPVQAVNWEHLVQRLAIKPVNVEERLGFVLRRPFAYHAYVQISELMTEQTKQLAKYQAMREK